MSSTAFYNSQNLVGIGSVGIGTTNPATALDVFTGTMNAATVVATTYYGALAGSNTGTFSNIYSANALTTTNLFANTLVASGQVQSLDSLRGHALPSDAMIVASATQVNPTNQNTGSYAIVESAGATIAASNLNMTAVTQSPFADLYKEGSMYTSNVATSNITAVLGSSYLWTSGLTAECWVNFVNNPTALVNPGGFNIYAPCAMSGTYTATASVIPWSLGLDTNGKVVFYYYNASGSGVTTSQSANTNISISLNTWNHIAVSVPSGGPISIYINGVQQTIQQNITGSTGSTLAIVGTGYSSQYLGAGGLGGSFMNGYIADYRVTYGAALYTGSSFTVPSAPLGIAGSGTTVALIRAGQNSPTIQNGALTFDRGLKQYMNFGPQTFNIVTQGFTAVWKGAFTGTVASYERIFEFGTGASTGNIVALRSIATGQVWFVVYPSTGGGSSSVTSVASLTQGVTYVLTFRYNPTTQILDIWINGAQNTSATVTTATLIADRTVAFTYLSKAIDTTQNGQFTSNTLAIYNRALSNTEIYNAFLALNTVPATPQQKTLEIGDVNGTPALSVAGNGQVSVQSIGLSSNVVPWPPAAMTGYVTSINGKNYVASASSDQYTGSVAYAGWTAFAKGASGALGWVTVSGTYNTSAPYGPTGATTTVDVNGSSYPGEWLQIQIPSSIVLSNYQINTGGSSTSQRPSKWFLLGSRDGVNWFLIDSQNGVTLVTSTFVTFTVPVGQAFTYFRWVVNQIGGAPFCNGGQIVYYGTADASPSLTIAPATTFVTSVTTPSLVGVVNNASFAPQDFSSSGLNIPAYVVSNTATVANTVAYSSFGPFAGEGSLQFPGGSRPVVAFPPGTSPNFTLSSTSVCTFEAWIYPTLSAAGVIFSHASTSSLGYDYSLYIETSTKLGWYPLSGTAVYSTNNVNLNAWNHVAWTFTGGTVYLALNGVVNSASMGTPASTATYSFCVGNNSYTYFNGYIACARIVSGLALYTTNFQVPTQSLQPIQGTTQAGLPYGTVLLLRNAPAPGRIQTTRLTGSNSVGVNGAPLTLPFPPAAMTGYSTALNAGYGQGTYVASASSELTGSYAWYAFDKNTGGNSWVSGGGYGPSYSWSNVTVDVTGTSYLGEWVQVQTPSSIVLANYTVVGTVNYTTKAPVKWWVVGSRDGISWSLVDSRSGISWSSSWQFQTFTVAQVNAFTYYRLIVNATTGAGTYVEIADITYNGTLEAINITNDGRVGLGVVNPTRALEVAGDVVCGGTLSAGNPLMFRNRIINGNFNVWQRGTTFTVSTNIYTADRWVTPTNAPASITVSQSTNVPFRAGFQSSLALATATTGSPALIEQRIEQLNTYDLYQGTPITISFWARQSVGTPGVLNIEPLLPSGVNTFTGYTDACTPSLQQIQLSSNWQYYTLTYCIAVLGVATNGLSVQWWQPNTVNPATILLTGVQLEKGSVATPFEVRPYATELALCQRYYQKTYNMGTAPGTNVSGVGAIVVTASNSTIVPGAQFRATMRAAPTIVMYNPYSTTSGVIGLLSNGFDTGAATAEVSTTSDSGFRYVAVTVTSGVIYQYHYTANAEL